MMGYYDPEASLMSDEELRRELNRCRQSQYSASPASDWFYYYQALLREQRRREQRKPKSSGRA